MCTYSYIFVNAMSNCCISRMGKKPVQYNTSRPQSMERERTHTPTTNLPKRSSPHLPKQPFIQDPNMPLMQPPEPLTVLEEARRRIDMSNRQQRMSRWVEHPSQDSGMTWSCIECSVDEKHPLCYRVREDVFVRVVAWRGFHKQIWKYLEYRLLCL